jgi:hypothetical protein
MEIGSRYLYASRKNKLVRSITWIEKNVVLKINDFL